MSRQDILMRFLPYANYLLGSRLRTTRPLFSLIKENILPIPAGLLFNTFTNRIVLDNPRNRLRGAIPYQQRIVNRVPNFGELEIITRIRNLDLNDHNLIHMLETRYQDGSSVFRTITAQNREHLIDLIRIGFEIIPGFDTGSDNVYAAEFREIIDWVLITQQRGRVRPQGAFFKYLIPFEGLEEFGLYTSFCKSKYTDNCLIRALKACGIKNEKLLDLKLKCKNDMIPRIYLKQIALDLDIHIHLKIDKLYRIDYNKNASTKINIGLIDEHYFAIKPTKFTSYAINHFEDIIHIKDWNKIYKKSKNEYKKSNDRFIDSFAVIDLLIKNKDKLTLIDRGLIDNQKYKNGQEIPLQILENNYREIVPPNRFENDKEKTKILFFDFESSPFDVHKPFLVDLNDDGEHHTFQGDYCCNDFLEFIIKKYLKYRVILIAHNLRYDFGFLFTTKGFKTLNNIIKTGNMIKQVIGLYKGKKLIFKDSYSIIPKPLRDFGKCFKLDTEKEVMPYNLYTLENIKTRYIPARRAKPFLTNEQFNQFMENIIKWKLKDGQKFDIIEYAKIYCKLDTETLRKGYMQFREWIHDLSGIDIIDSISISQIAHRYFLNRGCYNGVYELSGSVKEFIRKCIIGGRVMLRNNKKIHIKKKIQDFDGVSLYPSSIYRLPGFVKGIPKILETTDYETIKNYDMYYVKINVKSIGKKRKFPLLSKKIDEIRDYKNECGKYYVDKIGLEDLIKFQNIKFDIIEGVYFNEGFNKLSKKVILELFNERIKKKNEKNPIQEVYKLILNSVYGKTIQGSYNDAYKFCYSKEELFKVINYNSALINQINKYSEDIYVVKLNKAISTQFNICHVGCNILSMSKRIMNEVICLGEDEKINIYYTDTDSIHIDANKIEKLSEKYKEIYNRELIGKNLGQFHTDFQEVNGNESWSKEFIGLGKKCYLDVLTNKKGDIDYHIRMKGIPSACIKNPIETYKKLYEGGELTFNLSEVKPTFNSSGFGNVSTVKKLERTIKF